MDFTTDYILPKDDVAETRLVRRLNDLRGKRAVLLKNNHHFVCCNCLVKQGVATPLCNILTDMNPECSCQRFVGLTSDTDRLLEFMEPRFYTASLNAVAAPGPLHEHSSWGLQEVMQHLYNCRVCNSNIGEAYMGSSPLGKTVEVSASDPELVVSNELGEGGAPQPLLFLVRRSRVRLAQLLLPVPAAVPAAEG